MKYYDKENNRLIWLNEQATSEYWADLWRSAGIDRSVYRKSTYISTLTAKYLKPEDGPILEAGCGRGIHVYALQQQGYKVIGVDFAQDTIEKVKELVPQLEIQQGDVTDLTFEENSFAGYWSLGLIEHFWNGYDPLVAEAWRVLRPGGLAFFTFPHVSPLRQYKAKRAKYPAWPSAENRAEPENFYQFGLDPADVRRKITACGFEFVDQKRLDGVKGFKSEVPWAAPTLQKIYDYRGKSIFIRGGRYLIDKGLTPFSGHSMLLVFRKSQNKA